jgi:hypothetical protein
LTRQVAVRALVVAASLVLVLALIAGYVRRAGVDSDQFANRATVALRDDSVRSLIADKVTDDVVLKHQSDLVAARPIIQSFASTIVGSRAFTNLFRAAVRDAHRAVFQRDRDTFTLTVADVGTVLAAVLERLRPTVAKKVESTSRVELIERDVGSVSGDLARLADKVRLLALFLLVLTLALVAGALTLSRDKRHTVVELGIGAAAGGIVLLVAYGVTRSVAIDHAGGPEGRAAAGAVWDAFLGDLRTAGWILAGSGAVVAAAAASLIRPVDVREPLQRAAAWVATEPQRPVLRILRGVGFLAAGLLVIFKGDAVLQLAITLVGVYVVYEGATAILRVIYRPPAPAERRVPAPVAASSERRRLAVPVIAAAVIAAVIVVFVGSGGTTTAAPARGPCNGHEELCGRPLDRVALAATHNAMSVPLPGWYSAEQDRPISDQLADGVRGLLIDTHYADRLSNGKLRTDFGTREDLRRQAKQDGISSKAVDAAKRIRERIGFSGKGKRGAYLCHTFCELGGTPLPSVLDDVHDFLIAHPDDVLVIINQDYVTPQDFVAAVKKAKLEDLVYRGPTSGNWPTLRQMIDRSQRVVFLAENHAGAASWYQLAYKKITEETPYTFPKVAQLTTPEDLPSSCKANRGPAAAPLFLINHWISTDPFPRPSDAAKVNAYDPLLRRAQECQRLRKHFPNLLAVNFYRQGDVFRVVNRLNGVK